MIKPKILMVSDNPNWALARECDAIEKFLSYKYDFVKAYACDKRFLSNVDCRGYVYELETNIEDYDLIFIREPIFYPHYNRFDKIGKDKLIISLCSNHFYDNSEKRKIFLGMVPYFKYVFCISDEIFEKANILLSDFNIQTHFTPMGIDLDIFYNTRNTKKSSEYFTVGWAGNVQHLGKNLDHKRFFEIVLPLVKDFNKSNMIINNKKIRFSLALNGRC